MKLRNKKTGAIVECEGIVFTHCNTFGLDWEQYGLNVNSLAEFIKEWEDYDLDKPFIGHEDIRKALRWWAVSNGITNDASLLFVGASNGFTCENQYISFDSAVYDMSEKLISGNTYELAKLCGEEK